MVAGTGDNNAQYTTTQAAFASFTANGILTGDAPAVATGLINAGGIYKQVRHQCTFKARF